MEVVDNATVGIKEKGWENWTGFVWFRKGLFRSQVIMLFLPDNLVFACVGYDARCFHCVAF